MGLVLITAPNSKNQSTEVFSAIPINGYSAAQAPNQVKTMKVLTTVQNKNRVPAVYANPLNKVFRPPTLKTNRISTAAARATTPPNLFGTARRIAYANKKYHSG